MSYLNWKTIDKLEAKVPGATCGRVTNPEEVTFDVKLGRVRSPLFLRTEDADEEEERFRIENTILDIAVEAGSLQEAKKKLREVLASRDDFSGVWKLWMKVSVSGGHDDERSWGRESANCSISVEYIVELTSGTRKRHRTLTSPLPKPFTGEFPIPTSYKDLARLDNGGAVPKRGEWSFDRDEVWVEATPEIVETIRMLQIRLGESGKRVKDALSKKRFMETLELVRQQSDARLLPAGIVPEV